MKTIYKYPIGSPDSTIEMPQGAQILTIHDQEDVPTIWALVDTDAEPEGRRFLVFGTGWEITKPHNKHLSFLGTSFGREGLVWHVFEVLEA